MKFIPNFTPSRAITYILFFIIIDDVILADRGFLCDEFSRMDMVDIKHLLLLKGKKRLKRWILTGVGSYLQFELMVKGVIAVLKQKYRSFPNALQLKFFNKTSD